MAKKTYDPANVNVSFNGSIINGFAESFIEIEYDEDTFSKQVGAGGEVTRTRNRNAGGKITLRLLQDSLANDILHAAWLADQNGNLGSGVFQMDELNGTTRVVAVNAWVMKAPVIRRGKEAQEVEWVLDTDRLDHVIGGLLV